jgi:hypothetical protein
MIPRMFAARSEHTLGALEPGRGSLRSSISQRMPNQHGVLLKLIVKSYKRERYFKGQF